MNKAGVVSLTRVLLIIGIVLQIGVALSFVLGPNGLGVDLPRLRGWIPEGVYQIHAEGVLVEPPSIGIDLSTRNTPEGMIDASTGLPAVELSGPYTAVVNLMNPSRGERIAYISVRGLTATLVAVIFWVLLRLVSSVRKETAFTAANSKRIWTLAGLVAIGGTFAGGANAQLSNTLIQQSAAAEAFTSEATLSLAPLLAGLLLAVLGITWSRGLALEEETEGLI